MRRLLAGIAVAALLAAPAAAGPGEQHGAGKPDKRGPAMAAPGKPPKQGPAMREAAPQAERRDEPRRDAKPGRAMPERVAEHRTAERKDAGGPREARAPELREAKAGPPARGPERRVIETVVVDDRRFHKQPGYAPRIGYSEPRRRLFDGCPPGLAKRHDGCVPPGFDRPKPPRYRYVSYQPDWWGYRDFDRGTYYYDDGYLVRLYGGRIRGYVPLFGGALAIGNPWPAYYEPVVIEPYYVSYYDLGPRDRYRYADHVIYRVEPRSNSIVSVAALLTGDDFVVGRRMPPGYDVYNVPYDYRDRYYDRDDAYYRYSDGYVYEVDPTTLLIVAAIELLA